MANHNSGVYAYQMSHMQQPLPVPVQKPYLNREHTVVDHQPMQSAVKEGKYPKESILGKPLKFWFIIMAILLLFVVVGVSLAVAL